ncbi:2-oxo acid dehydrogenase subunit E2 [Candidatus Peregrinibacteria bacterium]|nr:2-oxo acid dehydrogenase subunit E2 [Candidatus Peregrinibacteria bacterium]
MAFDFNFPDVGEGIHEGKIVKWLVKEGDTIKADDTLAEVETDKAVVEIPSPKSGKITKLYHKEGEVMKVGEVMASIEEVAGATASAPANPVQTPAATQPAPAAAPAAPKEETHQESTGVVGSLEETAPGVWKAPTMEMSGAVFGDAVMTPKVEPTPQPVAQVAAQTSQPAQSISAQPSTTPTQPQPATAAPAASTGGVGVVKAGIKAVKKYDLFGYVDRAKYDGIRKAIGDQMVKSKFTIPHVTHTDMADVTELFRLREKEKVAAEKEGIKLTFLPFFIKAVVAGLKKHPYLNSSLNEQDAEIILKKYFNIGLAVDTEHGLFVPVIKGADKKSILAMAKEIMELAAKAREKKLNSMDMKGGTFTITNIGSAGGGWFATPVINYPEAAILGTGMIQDMVVAIDGKAKVRKMLPLSLSFDHRILDGAEAARFVMTVKAHLEDPDLMLVEGQ